MLIFFENEIKSAHGFKNVVFLKENLWTFLNSPPQKNETPLPVVLKWLDDLEKNYTYKDIKNRSKQDD